MKIKVSTFCNHQWKAVPAIGVRKYMCTQCSMFGFKRKDDPLHRIYEHSVEVSDDLLDQYILQRGSEVTHTRLEEKSGPKPGIIRMREDDACAHEWVPAPEYSNNHHDRLKCVKCNRVGREKSTGEVEVFVEEYAETLKRYHLHNQHLEKEPMCAHDWESAPQLSTKGVIRYVCKKCGWLGYRLGMLASIKPHSVFSNDKIKGRHGLRKVRDGEKRKAKESVLPEEIKKEGYQGQEELHSAATEDGSDVRGTDGREDSMGKQPDMRS